MALVRGRSRRQLVTFATVLAVVGIFAWQWAQAPRVRANATVSRQLAELPPHELYLGTAFEGLALVSVRPFVYTNCPTKHPRAPEACEWVRVAHGRVTGSDAKLVHRARKNLRPVRGQT